MTPPSPAAPSNSDAEATRRVGTIGVPLMPPVGGPRDAQALPKGTLLNAKFEVIGLLGKPGGFGIPYLCRDTKLSRQVVVKELFPAGMVTRLPGTNQVAVVHEQFASAFALQLQLLLDEARKLAALEHVESVVKVYDHFTENNTAYIVMHQVLGRSLGEHLREVGRIDAARLMRWIWPLLEGLQAVHGTGVLHRDIKPDNVLVDLRDHPVLIDFGNAAAMHGPGPADGDYFAVSPSYGAPEQYTNDLAQMGPWTDLYSVGAVMYVALSGNKPVDAMQRQAGQSLVPIQNLAPNTPAELVQAIEDCLQLQPQRRPADVKSLMQSLARLQPHTRQWPDFLPSDAFGQRMRRLHTQVQQGQLLPKQWNTSAALLQGLWLFMHQLTVPGLMWASGGAFVVLALLWPQDPWPALPLALGSVWLLALLPCGLFADLLQYRSLSLLGASLPLATAEQGQHAQAVLAAHGRPRWRSAPLAALLPAMALLMGHTLHERQMRGRESVANAIELTGLREQFKTFLSQNGRPPGADDLPPFTPNGEIGSVELRPSGLELVLALPEFSGRRLRWLLDGNGRWTCETVDLPARHVPAACRKA